MENIKPQAWKFLIQHEMGKFPIELINLKFKEVGFVTKTYSESKSFLESIKKIEYTKRYKAFSMNYDFTNYIFYDEKLSFSDKGYVIAHEIGHIILNHTVNNDKVYAKGINEEDEIKQEKEANIFALALLAPAPVLLEMDIHTPEGISRVTGIDIKLCDRLVFDIIREKSIEKTGIEVKLIETFRETIDLHKSSIERATISCMSEISSKEPEKIVNIIVTNPQNSRGVLQTVGKKERKKNRRLFIKVGSLVVSCLTVTISTIIGVQKIKGDSIIELDNNNAVQTTPQIENSDNSYLLPQSAKNTEINFSANSSIEVVTTKSGTKYHLPTCHYIKDKNNLKVMSKEEADKEGFSPCKSCHPDDRISN